MHAQLEKLLEIQDLKAQRRELSEAGSHREVEEELFNVSIEEALGKLDAKIAEMEESLDDRVRNRYRRLGGKRNVIVPVIQGTCYGCFVSIPTALASDAERNEELRNCDNCGRFLYVID